MSETPCTSPVGIARLLEYWLGELDLDHEEQIDEHLLGCGPCAATLEELLDLGGEIRSCARRGSVRAVVTDAFLWRLAADWVRVREYRVACNGSVQCTVAPADDLVVARLEAPLAGVARLDLVICDIEGEGRDVLRDVPFDAAAGEVVLIPEVESIRALPKSTVRMQLVAAEGAATRVVGDYTFLHTPWGQV